jgi:hypothetical protein
MQEVVGSNPASQTNNQVCAWFIIALWCNGSTSDFESEIIGSIPIRATRVDKLGEKFMLSLSK